MKRLFAVTSALALVASVFVLSALPALGADSATVKAQVTIASPCLSVAFSSGAPALDFGELTFSTGAVPTARQRSGDLVVTNCSGVEENVAAKGTDASSSTGTSTWSLGNVSCGSGATKNVYAAAVDWGPGQVGLTKTDQQLGTIPGSSSRGPVTWLYTPCTSSDGAGETMTFQIVYTASL